MLKLVNFVNDALDQSSLCTALKQIRKQGTDEGDQTSGNSAYHINHSNKVVHLKWGVKRSLILPRSSCFKTRTCHLLSSPPDVRPPAGSPTLVNTHDWEAGREVSGGLDTQDPRPQDSNPQGGRLSLSCQDPAMRRDLIPYGWRCSSSSPPPPLTWNAGAGKQTPSGLATFQGL